MPANPASSAGKATIPPLAVNVDDRKSMSKRISLLAVAFLAFAAGLPVSDACAQYYLSAQGGWTGLPYQTDTIDGQGPVPVEFAAGYNVGVRGGYQLGPWRFEEEYSYRQDGATQFGAGNGTNAINGNRHTHSIMTNVLYDLATGWPITPHIGVGVGAMDVFDSLRSSGGAQIFNDSNWQFAYQAIAGLRYVIYPHLALDVDYRYLATTESTFRIPNTTLHYRSGANTNNLVASVTYRFTPPPPAGPPIPAPP
jgi:OmpA-OmpF porin, OOP family